MIVRFDPNPILIPRARYDELVKALKICRFDDELTDDNLAKCKILPLYYKPLINTEIALLSDEAKDCVVLEEDNKKAFNGVWIWVDDGNTELPDWWKQFLENIDDSNIPDDYKPIDGFTDTSWENDDWLSRHTMYMRKLDITYEFSNEDISNYTNYFKSFKCPIISNFETLAKFAVEDISEKQWKQVVNGMKEHYQWPETINSYYYGNYTPSLLDVITFVCGRHSPLENTYTYNNYKMYSSYSNQNVKSVKVTATITRWYNSKDELQYKVRFTSDELENGYILAYPFQSNLDEDEIAKFITITNNSQYQLKED